MYLEQRFLSLIQSIESYHRRTRINDQIDIDEYENKLIHIIKSVDDKYQSWLESRLAFINKVCNTRNYFTHYDISLAYKKVKEFDLLDICNSLEIIIIFNLLSEVGFENKNIKELLEKRYRKQNMFE